MTSLTSFIILVVFFCVLSINILLLRFLSTEHLIKDTSHKQTELIEERIEVAPEVIKMIFCAREALLNRPQSVFVGACRILEVEVFETFIGHTWKVREDWDSVVQSDVVGVRLLKVLSC